MTMRMRMFFLAFPVLLMPPRPNGNHADIDEIKLFSMTM